MELDSWQNQLTYIHTHTTTIICALYKEEDRIHDSLDRLNKIMNTTSVESIFIKKKH